MLYTLLAFSVISLISPLVGRKPSIRIIGGRDAVENEYPFVVRMEGLITKGGKKEVGLNFHGCTAAVITPTRTLTAAHCIEGIERNLAELATTLTKQGNKIDLEEVKSIIRYGSVHDSPLANDVTSDITNSVMHPAYRHITTGTISYNFHDVGICSTNPIKLDMYGKLSAVDLTSLIGHEVTLLGYGLTNASNGMISDTLYLRKPLQTMRAVVKRCPKTDAPVYPGMCLARACGQSSSVCSGDSGGPMLHPSGIVAVNSMAVLRDCLVRNDAKRTFKVAYVTSLSSYMDWIQAHL